MFRWVSQPHCIRSFASILACCRRTPCCLLLRLLHCSGSCYLLLQCAGGYRCCHGCRNGACRSSSYYWQLHLLRATHCSHLLGWPLYCRSHCCHCLNLKQWSIDSHSLSEKAKYESKSSLIATTLSRILVSNFTPCHKL